MKKTRCYIYLRVSTEMQVDGYSLDAQRDRMLKFAEYQDMEVVREYCDAGKSGKSITGRPEFQKMMDDVSYGKDNIDYILVFKLSRFGRNAADVLNSLQFIQDYGVNLICVEDGIDSSKESGKLTITVLSAVAEIERENILIQTMEGRKQKAREGKWNGGVPPYGYLLNKENDTIVVDPESANIVKQIYKMYVKDDMTLVDIADYLNSHGYKKKKYRPNDLDYYNSNFIRNVLDNPVYIGKIAYGRTKTEKVKGTRDEYRRIRTDAGMISEGLHEAIIDDDLWEGAQIKNSKAQNRRMKKHSLEHEYLLSGLIKCPVCGGTITGTTAKRKSRKTGEIYYDFYYRCHNRNRLEDGSQCPFKASFKEETLDQEVFETIKNFVSSEGCHRELMSHLDDTVDVTALEVEKTQLQGQLKQVVGAKDNLLERIDILDIEDKHYNRKVEDMNTRLSNLYDKIGNIEESLRVINRRIAQVRQKNLSSKDVYRALLNFEKIYNEMTDLEKKEFYQNFIEEVQVHQDRDRSDRMVKSISFNFPLYYNGNVGDTVVLPKDKNVETVVKLSLKKDTPKIEVTMEPDEESNYTPEEKITYQKIKAYILEKYGFKVSSLYIAQIKDKCGLGKERTGNNWKKNDKSKEPQCTPEKEEAIRDAFKNFNII